MVNFIFSEPENRIIERFDEYFFFERGRNFGVGENYEYRHWNDLYTFVAIPKCMYPIILFYGPFLANLLFV